MKKRILALLLVLTCVIGILPSATAINSSCETYLEEIDGGMAYIQKSSSKIVAIATNNDKHIISISILYRNNASNVYQWIINDYPYSKFNTNDPSFWNDVIKYAEEKLSQASVVTFSIEEAGRIAPRTVGSSAGADLTADMVAHLGKEYSDKYIQVRRMDDGRNYKLYETMEFDIQKVNTLSWKSGVTLTSVIVNVLSLIAGSTTVGTICSVLGLASTVAEQVLPAGKMNKYGCMALYTRYVTVENNPGQQATATKIISYEGYEDASDNSTGRAHIISDTKLVYYSGNQTEQYYLSGIFEEAYRHYNKLWD